MQSLRLFFQLEADGKAVFALTVPILHRRAHLAHHVQPEAADGALLRRERYIRRSGSSRIIRLSVVAEVQIQCVALAAERKRSQRSAAVMNDV